MGQKRDLSIFDAIDELDTQDRKAERKRRKNTSAEKKKVVEAQSQSKIYNHILESRILLQRLVNKVKYASNSGKNVSILLDTSNKYMFRETCGILLEHLLHARNQLFGALQSDPGGYKDLMLPSVPSVTNLHNSMQNEYEKHRDNWKRILNRKYKSLRLHSGATVKSEFRVMDSSFWEQVEGTIEYEEIRQHDVDAIKSVLFDDSKIYQQLLKDFVANSTNSGDHFPKETMRLSMNNRKNSTSTKLVDRRASKGRKIRYKDIPKLVNFTFPLSRQNSSSLNREDYFQSLFGSTGSSFK